MILPQEIVNYIHDFIRPTPTLRTIVNWRKGSIKFDIHELRGAYFIDQNRQVYVKRIKECSIHDYNKYTHNPSNACNCPNYHIIRPYSPYGVIWKDNHLALWKLGPNGNKLIWIIVELYECDYCGDIHMSCHISKIYSHNYCNCCYDILYGGITSIY